MLNIFNSLQKYAEGWSVKSSRDFSEAEINAVSSNEVVPSSYGNSVCFHLKGGGQSYIPLAKDATVGIGESIDMSKAKLLTLGQSGSADIQRVSI